MNQRLDTAERMYGTTEVATVVDEGIGDAAISYTLVQSRVV